MRAIKYLHIMTHPAMFFNGNVIDMINTNIDIFDPKEHLFIVGYSDIYERYSIYDNVIFIPKIMTRNYMKFLKYSNNAQFVFLHQNWFYDFVRLFFTPISIRKKYIWCVWGHDLYTNHGKTEGTKEYIKLFIRKFGDLLINIESRWYRGVGIGFKYDSLEIKKRFKNKLDIFMCPYPSGTKIKDIDSIIMEQNNNNNNTKKIKIMVGHSAHQYLNHFDILKKLSAYKDENIMISLPLIYGNEKYASEVEEYALELFGDKVEVLKERLDKHDYIRYLKSVDIAIMDQIHQTGLGNLNYFMYLGKKVFLNPKGILKQAFLLESIYFDSTDYIGNETFDSFVKKNKRLNRAREYARFTLNERNRFKMWKSTFDLLL
jgi:dTDP-N-acetylfucosamine:lipid II N-acetylfucosaminyltransferase